MLEEIRASKLRGEFWADFTNLIYVFASYRQGNLAANVDHAARRLDKSRFSNVMAGFFLVDH